jgi:hypothetical protein
MKENPTKSILVNIPSIDKNELYYQGVCDIIDNKIVVKPFPYVNNPIQNHKSLFWNHHFSFGPGKIVKIINWNIKLCDITISHQLWKNGYNFIDPILPIAYQLTGAIPQTTIQLHSFKNGRSYLQYLGVDLVHKYVSIRSILGISSVIMNDIKHEINKKSGSIKEIKKIINYLKRKNKLY